MLGRLELFYHIYENQITKIVGEIVCQVKIENSYRN